MDFNSIKLCHKRCFKACKDHYPGWKTFRFGYSNRAAKKCAFRFNIKQGRKRRKY